jgi:Holliday junction resolvase RusA-like endonuclease
VFKFDVFIPGIPAPGGSKRAFRSAGTGRIVVVDDAKNNRGWRNQVAATAADAMGSRPPADVPIVVCFEFTLPRPRGHYGTGRNAGAVRPSAPRFPAVKPDALKLARAAEDALTGIVYRDDAQTVSLRVDKRYGFPAGCRITIYEAAEVPLVEVLDGSRAG